MQGDVGLLRSFRDALRGAADLYPAGRMRYQAESTSGSRPADGGPLTNELRQTTEGEVRWTPRGTRWDVTTASDGTAFRRSRKSGGPAPGARFTILFDARSRRLVRFMHDGRDVSVYQIEPGAAVQTRVHDRTLLVRPADLWFASPAEVPWSRMIDPDGPVGAQAVTRLVVSGEGRAVTVERHHVSGSRYVLRGTFGEPARVLSSASDGPGPDVPGLSSDLTWETAGDGAPFPRELTHRRWFTEGDQRFEKELVLHVLSYEPLPAGAGGGRRLLPPRPGAAERHPRSVYGPD